VNVTVWVPRALGTAVEGRQRLELGLPPSADLTDVLQSLLALYPKLAGHLASDRTAAPEAQLGLMTGGAAGRALSAPLPKLREGQAVYLVAGSTRRQQALRG
jgi:hypothetical protein